MKMSQQQRRLRVVQVAIVGACATCVGVGVAIATAVGAAVIGADVSAFEAVATAAHPLVFERTKLHPVGAP